MARAAVCVPGGAAPTRWPCAASPSPMPAPQSAGGCLKTSSRPSRLWQTPCPHRGAAHAALCWPHTAHPPSAQELDAAGRAREEGYLERPGAAAQQARPSNPRAPARRPASAQSAPPAPHPQTSATASRRRPPWRPCRALARWRRVGAPRRRRAGARARALRRRARRGACGARRVRLRAQQSLLHEPAARTLCKQSQLTKWSKRSVGAVAAASAMRLGRKAAAHLRHQQHGPRRWRRGQLPQRRRRGQLPLRLLLLLRGAHCGGDLHCRRRARQPARRPPTGSRQPWVEHGRRAAGLWRARPAASPAGASQPRDCAAHADARGGGAAAGRGAAGRARRRLRAVPCRAGHARIVGRGRAAGHLAALQDACALRVPQGCYQDAAHCAQTRKLEALLQTP